MTYTYEECRSWKLGFKHEGRIPKACLDRWSKDEQWGYVAHITQTHIGLIEPDDSHSKPGSDLWVCVMKKRSGDQVQVWESVESPIQALALLHEFIKQHAPDVTPAVTPTE